jgi:hypothetical protein
MKKGALHLPQGVGGVRVVQGTVRALFYTKFARKKGTSLSLGGVTPNNPHPKSAPGAAVRSRKLLRAINIRCNTKHATPINSVTIRCKTHDQPFSLRGSSCFHNTFLVLPSINIAEWNRAGSHVLFT